MSSTLAAKIRALQAEAKANFNTNNIYFLDAPTMEHWGFKVKVLGSSTQQQESLMRLKQSTFYLEISQSCQAIDLALSKIKVLIDAVINQDIDLKVKLCSYDLIVNDQVSANRMRLLEIDSFLAQQSKLKNSIYFLNSLKGVLQLYPLAYFLQEQNFKSADLNLNLNILDCFTPEQKEQIQHMAVLLDSKHEPCKWLLNVATLSKALCSQEDLGIIYACSLLGLDNLLQAFNSLKRMESDLTIDQMIDKLSALYNNDTHATIVRLQDFVTGSSYASFKLKKADPLDGYDFINHIANKNPKELVLNVDLKAVAKKGLTLTNVAPTKAKKGLELTNVAASVSTKPASLESKPVAHDSVAPAPQADEAAKSDNAPAKAKKGLELTNVAASASTKPASVAPTKEERAPVVKESTKVEAMSDSENAIKSDESKRNKDELEDVYVELDDRAFNVVKNYYERTDMHEVQPTNFLHKAKQHFESIIENLEAFCEEKEHPTITKDPKHKVFRTTKTKEETKAKPLAPLPDATSIEDYNIIDVAALEEQENHSESDEGTVTVKTSAKSDAVLSQDKVNSQAASSDTDSAGLKIVWQLFSGEEIVETDRQRPVSHEIVSANLGTNSTVSKDQAKDNIKDSALASVGIEMTQVAPKANSDASSDYVSVQSGSSLRLENADQEIKGSGATLSNVLEVAPVALSLTNTQDQAKNTLVLQAASDTKNLELGALPNSGAHESSLGGISALTDGLNLVAARIETNTFQGAEYVLSNQKQTLPAINEVLTQDNTDALKAKSISADSEDKELEHSKPSSKGSSLLAKIKEKDKKTTKKKRDLEAEKAKAQGVWEMAISKTKDESSDSSTAKATKEQPSEATTLELQNLNAKPAVASSSTDVAADIQEPEQDTQGLTDLENQGLDKSNASQESTASEDKSAAHKLDRVRDLAQAVNHGIAKKKQAQAKALACDSITSEAQLTEAEKSKALLQQKPTDEQLAAYKEACSMVGVHKSTSCHNISASDHLAQDVIKNPYSNNSSSTSLANLLTKEDKAPKASAVTNETMHVGTFDPLTATYIATESSSSCEQVAAPKEDKTPEASVSSSAVTNDTMHVGAFDPLSANYIATESSSSCEQVAATNALRTQKQEQSEAEKTTLADTATIEAQGEGETESFDDDFMQDFLASQSPDFFGDNFSNNENYNYPDNAARENDWDQLLECDDALIKLKYTVLYAQSMLLTQSQYDSLLEGNPFTAPQLRAWQNVANSTLNQSLGTIKTLEGYKETMIDLLSNHNNDMNVLNQHLSKFKYYRRTLGTTWEVQANNVKGPYGKAERVSFESLANTNKVHFVLACLLLCAGNISKLANECLLERAYKNCNLESPI